MIPSWVRAEVIRRGPLRYVVVVVTEKCEAFASPVSWEEASRFFTRIGAEIAADRIVRTRARERREKGCVVYRAQCSRL